MSSLKFHTLCGWTVNDTNKTYATLPGRTKPSNATQQFDDIVSHLLTITDNAYPLYDEYHANRPTTTRYLASTKDQLTVSGQSRPRVVTEGLFLDVNNSNDGKDKCIRALCEAFGYTYGEDVILHWEKKMKIGIIYSQSGAGKTTAVLEELVNERFPDAEIVHISVPTGGGKMIADLDMVIMNPPVLTPYQLTSRALTPRPLASEILMEIDPLSK